MANLTPWWGSGIARPETSQDAVRTVKTRRQTPGSHLLGGIDPGTYLEGVLASRHGPLQIEMSDIQEWQL